jgi:hypothetical protein
MPDRDPELIRAELSERHLKERVKALEAENARLRGKIRKTLTGDNCEVEEGDIFILTGDDWRELLREAGGDNGPQ